MANILLDESKRKNFKSKVYHNEPPIIVDAIKKEYLKVFFKEEGGMITGLITNLVRDFYTRVIEGSAK